MPDIIFKLCDNFKVSNLVCSCCRKDKRSKEDEIEFELVSNEEKKYHNLIPANDKYIYLKILDTTEIIAVGGELLSIFNLTSKDLINMKTDEITKCKDFFNDYLTPLIRSCIDDGEAYEFDFSTNIHSHIFTCSLYPCSIPEKINSVDIVIRYSKKEINNKDIKVIN